MVTSDVVQEGDYVVWDVCGDKQTLVEVKGNGKCKLGSAWVSVRQMVGKPWGCALEMGENQQLVDKEVEVEWDEVELTGKDNSKLVDANTQNQQMTSDDIAKLKAQGVSGAKIVEMLTESSATWESKTEFAQKKWLKRKAKKYCPWALVRRPTTASICEAMFNHQPHKIWEMRVDTLACMLSLANIGAYAKVLVFDDCGGLITGAVSERLGPTGQVLSVTLHEGKGSPFEVVRNFNLSADQVERLNACTYAHLMAAAEKNASTAAANDLATPLGGSTEKQASQANGTVQTEPQAAPQAAQTRTGTAKQTETQYAETQHVETRQAKAQQARAQEGDAMDVDGPAQALEDTNAAAMENTNVAANGGGIAGTSSHAEPQERAPAGGPNGAPSADGAAAGTVEGGPGPQQGAPAGEGPPQGGKQAKGRRRVPLVLGVDKVASMLAAGFDCLLIVSPSVDQTQLLRKVLPLLQPSSTFCVYSPWVQPLADAFATLQTDRRTVNLQLQESWFRDYQVLPQRTHPHMVMSGTGGFLLSGITVTGTPTAGAYHKTPGSNKKQRR